MTGRQPSPEALAYIDALGREKLANLRREWLAEHLDIFAAKARAAAFEDAKHAASWAIHDTALPASSEGNLELRTRIAREIRTAIDNPGEARMRTDRLSRDQILYAEGLSAGRAQTFEEAAQWHNAREQNALDGGQLALADLHRLHAAEIRALAGAAPQEKPLTADALGPQRPEHVRDGWIKWHGGECPIPKGARFEVRFCNGGTYIYETDDPVRWDHQYGGQAGDIVAYRVLPNKNAPGG